jgi:hypothetical protein
MKLAGAIVLVALALVLSSCGGASTTTTTSPEGKVVVSCHVRFAKTKFALHLGIAAGGFYRYIYQPYRAGKFKQGADGRRVALAKAAAAAAVALHELNAAAKAARCDGKALQQLAGPIDKLRAALKSLGGLQTAGGIGAIAAAQAAMTKLTKASAAAGTPIRESP